jgi:PASTA domain
MADEHGWTRPDAAGEPDEATRRMPADEPTSAYDPFEEADSGDVRDASDDNVRAGPGPDSAGDATRPMRPDDEATTRPMRPEEATTQRVPDSDRTAAMPADSELTRRVQPHVWAARVPVPPEDVPPPMPAADIPPPREPAPPRWQGEDGEDEPDRSWVRPVVITLVVVILLAMLGTGLWLIFNRPGGPSTPAPGLPPAPTPSAVPTPTATASPTGTATATGTAPTTGAPAPPPPPTTTAATARVSVPDLVGASEASAEQQLTAMGLTYTVARRTTSGAQPGTVIGTEPGPGAVVDKGSQVLLIVAAAPPTQAPGTPTPTPTPTPTR